MPLVLLSGYPCSGKTYRARQLAEYFESRLANSKSTTSSSSPKMSVAVVSDHSLHIPRSAYATAAAEKTARGTLSAAIIRALTPTTIVIVDAPSYIKGWRYQMFCEAKAQKTASCVVHVGTPIPQCRSVNEARLASAQLATSAQVIESSEDAPYDPPVFDNLIERYEEPNGMTRWDSPLFIVPYSDESPPCDAIWDALIGADGSGRLARPNAATVLPAARPADALSALERVSQRVVESIASWLKDHPGEGGGEISVEGTEEKVLLPADGVPTAQLQRLRRQFVGLYRRQAIDLKPDRMPAVFVQFLNDTWGAAG